MVKLKAKKSGRLANGDLQELIEQIRKTLTRIELSEMTEEHIDYFNGCMIRLKRANAEINLAHNYVSLVRE